MRDIRNYVMDYWPIIKPQNLAMDNIVRFFCFLCNLFNLHSVKYSERDKTEQFSGGKRYESFIVCSYGVVDTVHSLHAGNASKVYLICVK